MFLDRLCSDLLSFPQSSTFAWILLGGLMTLPVRLGPLVALIRLAWILLGGLTALLPIALV